jgi:hypothetical protein
MSLNEFVNNVVENIYKRVKEEQDGEMDAEQFQDAVDEILFEEIETAISHIFLNKIEKIIYEYGIDKAIRLYVIEFGSEQFDRFIQDGGRCSGALLFQIVRDEISLDYEEYLNFWNDIDD